MKYDEDFYNAISVGSASSARVIVDFIMKTFQPNSILEIGCGQGVWSREFINQGVTDLKAVDGVWIEKSKLVIDPDYFHADDLNNRISIGRRFDLTICLEVAEHLRPSSAQNLVETLTSHSDIIVFSAAIPLQGGTEHINEQPQSYWVNLFSEKGFECFDVIRPEIWHNKEVEVWYRQNILVFSTKPLSVSSKSIMDIVHPELFQYFGTSFMGIAKLLKNKILKP